MKTKALLIAFICVLFTSCASFFSAINVSPSQKLKHIEFASEPSGKNYQFYYSDTTGNEYLRALRQNYSLDSLVLQQSIELEKIKAILHWSSSQWEHNGSNTPTKSDALTILQEAYSGKQFRCVEYGIVAAACLNAVGIPSRVLGLKSRDVAKVKIGAAHVVAEVYSKELSKWIFIDPQMNLMPILNGVPLNAVEFQRAILNNNENIQLVNTNGNVDEDFTKSYLKWIGKYLYFFDSGFDQRINYTVDLMGFDGKKRIMLVPVGVENPTIFQRKYKINDCQYTNSLSDFYQVPTK